MQVIFIGVIFSAPILRPR